MSQCLTGPNNLGTWRVITKGTTLVPSASEVDSAQFNLNAGEACQLFFSCHVSADNNADVEVYSARTATDVDAFMAFDTSGSPAKVLVRLLNNNGSNSRTITYVLYGVIPP